jgi:hypothetical protein
MSAGASGGPYRAQAPHLGHPAGADLTHAVMNALPAKAIDGPVGDSRDDPGKHPRPVPRRFKRSAQWRIAQKVLFELAWPAGCPDALWLSSSHGVWIAYQDGTRLRRYGLHSRYGRQGMNMRFSRRTVWTAVLTTIVVGLVVAVGVGVGIVRRWPVARTWAQGLIGAGDIESARRAVAQVGAQFRDDRILQLSRTGEGLAGLAALAGNPELAAVRKWTAATPALGPLVQNGSYQKALEEAVRQNVPNIARIRLDQVASPEARALLAEVQQVVARNPQGAEAASTVNTNVLNLLKSAAFGRLRQNPGFARFLSGTEPAKEAE